MLPQISEATAVRERTVYRRNQPRKRTPLPDLNQESGTWRKDSLLTDEVGESYLEVREAGSEALVDVLHALYDRARFDLRLRYELPPDPPLAGDDTVWAQNLVAAAREAELP